MSPHKNPYPFFLRLYSLQFEVITIRKISLSLGLIAVFAAGLYFVKPSQNQKKQALDPQAIKDSKIINKKPDHHCQGGCLACDQLASVLKPAQRTEQLLKAEATPNTEEQCKVIALKARESRNFRYMALRKLEEMGSKETVPTAKKLAISTMVSDFIRLNAVGVLRRAAKKGDQQAQLALKEVAQDPSLAQFALAK